MVVASVRMKRMQADWAQNRKLHDTLLRKLEQMRRKSGRGAAR
jgi:hypothetical protein